MAFVPPKSLSMSGKYRPFVDRKTNNGNRRKTIVRRALCVSLAVVGTIALLGNMADRESRVGRSLLVVASRTLCDAFWNHVDYRQYWEELYYNQVNYPLLPRALRYPDADATNVAYVLTLTNCNDDLPVDIPAVDTQYDPAHAFYDAAAVLKYSICNCTHESSYTSTMYAVVHPDAVECLRPDGEYYDRVRVLEELGYWVSLMPDLSSFPLIT